MPGRREIAEIHGQIDERAHAYTAATFAGPGLGLIEPSGSGNIEVHPRSVAGEFAKEPGGDNSSSTTAAANVLNIGDGALDEFAVIVIKRHGPHFLAGAARAGEHFFGKRGVGAEDAGIEVAERHDDGAGQRGGIYEMRRAELFGISDAVREN